MTTILQFLMDGATKMAIVPMAIAAGISALGNLAGNILSTRTANDARRKQQQALDDIKAQEQSWYDKEYNADALQRADAQRAINMVSEQIKQRNRNVAGQAAVGGLTEEAVAQQKAEGNAMEAEVVSNVVANNQARKDAIADQHQANVMNMAQTQMGVDQANAEAKLKNIAAATQSVGGLATAIAGAQDLTPSAAPKVEVDAITPSGVNAPDPQVTVPDKIKVPDVLNAKTQLNKQ